MLNPSAFLNKPSLHYLAALAVLGSSIHAQTQLAEPSTVSASTDLELRLERLSERLEQRRIEEHIPGLALVVVQGDEVIFAQGFGLADLEQERAVTPQTLFAIGSTTKAFTSALIGMQVDEKKMKWKGPITDYLPDFKLPIRTNRKRAEVTVRDLLSHRTGFTRMSLLWAGATADTDTILSTATQAEPWADFGSKFLYNNVMYLAAGEACAKVAGASWTDLVKQRIFEPLKMDSSLALLGEVRDNPLLSKGYRYLEDEEEWEIAEMRSVDTCAPAGSIFSNLEDMARWIRLQLGEGTFEGQELISSKNLKETYRKRMTVSAVRGYGMGWMLGKWKGHKLVEHGGNIDGFSAEVALLPEDQLGFCLLTNVGATALQQESIEIVFGSLLSEPTDPGDYPDNLADYLGEYEAGFGAIQDNVEVFERNGRLFADIPGQMAFELSAPDEEGKWYWPAAPGIAVSFERSEDQSVRVMRMHQSGLNHELPRLGIDFPIEVPLEQFDPLLGFYQGEAFDGQPVEVVIQHNRLALDIPNQMVFELHPPNEEGKRNLRILPGAAALFRESDTGVEGMTFFQSGMELDLPRLSEAKAQELRPASLSDEQLELWQTHFQQASPIPSGKLLRCKGEVHSHQSGVRGEYTALLDSTGRYVDSVTFGDFGWVKEGFDGQTVWATGPITKDRVIVGKEAINQRARHVLSQLWSMADRYETPLWESSTTSEDQVARTQHVFVAQSKWEEDVKDTLIFDESTKKLMAKKNTLFSGMAGAIPQECEFSEYTQFGTLELPGRIAVSNDASGKVTITIASAELIDIDESLLSAPKGLK